MIWYVVLVQCEIKQAWEHLMISKIIYVFRRFLVICALLIPDNLHFPEWQLYSYVYLYEFVAPKLVVRSL